MGLPLLYALLMAYKKLIKIGPDVDKELVALKKKWNLQSHNKVLRRLLSERNGA